MNTMYIKIKPHFNTKEIYSMYLQWLNCDNTRVSDISFQMKESNSGDMKWIRIRKYIGIYKCLPGVSNLY